MKEIFEPLARLLAEKNKNITNEKALTWVELLWEDFESTYAKAGYEYGGKERTERVVRQWIENYGPYLHEFAGNNPKYQHFLNEGTKK
ncbi:YfhJ family protein [Peribacillus acanthi]|uniref:YfhJ family protein n=1 Tax=Peribacillus acanthi TaxID=2171554 RepID=UPI000D3E0F98|nr:YfhJ family protein [Peribacillus acanthi]